MIYPFLQLFLFWHLIFTVPRIMVSPLCTLRRNPPASKAFFSSRPAYLPLRQPAVSENISLRALLESHCPSVLSSFRPTWWLFKRVDVQFVLSHVLIQNSGHLQTIYGALGNFSVVDPVVYDRQVVSLLQQSLSHVHLRRRLLLTKDGGTLSDYLVQS